MEHVALRQIGYVDLKLQFLRNHFLPQLNALSVSRTSLAERCDLIDRIINHESIKFRKVNNDLINTKSNLNSEVLVDICLICGIPSQYFVSKTTFIDVVLLKRRNAIAHGEDTFLDPEDLDKITDETVEIMRAFSDALENHVVLQTYRATLVAM